jgi:1-acyl-sn-glycerol-3-phosphate acyltransferase
MQPTASTSSLSDVNALTSAPPGALARWAGSVRLAFRMASFVVLTLMFWAMMELDFLVRRRTRRIDVINTWTPRWSGTLLRVFGIRVEAHGPYADAGRTYPGRDERGIGRIFVMNHRSGADIPIMLSLVAAHVISRHDVANWPLIGSGGKRIGTLFVDRKSRRSGATVLKQIADALSAGEGVAMFPEGTAHTGDEVYEFKPGAFKAALRADAEIVPLGIAYEDSVAYFAGQPFLTHMKRIASHPRVRAAVEIGSPIRVDGRSAVELKDAVRAEVETLVGRARRRIAGRAQNS